MGLAAMSGAFKKQGLYYEQVIGNSKINILFDNLGYGYIEAAMLFFGLKSIQAYYLFDPVYYSVRMRKGPKAERNVANRIRKLVEANGWPKELSKYKEMFKNIS